MGKKLIAAVFAAALSGCATAKSGFCAMSSPLRLSAKAVDALSNEEARTLLAHNRKGEKLCGWRP
ncbi:hypothetical protein [Mesorhizobium sp.]|uniref:hypothetical protein n=1 Tax=Mesorhizobium sp. TaxID=1871066 RepID=UPI000FE47A6E|nr:hypothetical protein [Mesorhizobium sp.]RWD95743.1 MAG: hypothetical protein EOS39_00025 [Mesorhizobium sp.]